MKLREIKNNPNNPRVIRDEKFKQLVQSIKDFPEMMELRPMVVNDEMVLLGGNMRKAAIESLGMKDIPDSWVKKASDLTPEQQREFVIKDNVGFGVWDWDNLANEWDVEQLNDWGLDVLIGFDLDVNNLGDEFSLPDGDKPPFQQMTFTLADEQAEKLQNCISDIKQTDDYKYAETFGNENTNGNALYLIAAQWAEQRK